MRLLHAQLRHVRLHRELAVRFHPRFTLLGGANETGKSTLVEALHKGLFLKASATGKGVEELRSSRHGGQPEVEIGFEAAGGTWLLRKRFSGSSGTVQLSDGAGVQLSGAAAEEQLAALLGVEGAVEGRQISQLPQRWAHLWVRQGDAGANPLDGRPGGYDLDRLVQQLQQRGSSAALESPLDRRVETLLQAERDQLFTATGKVKAGSALASAHQEQQQASAMQVEARQRLAQLNAALDHLQRIETRLQTIDSIERPALEAQLQARSQSERQLEQGEANAALERSRREPLAQQLAAVEGQLQQLSQLAVALSQLCQERDRRRSEQLEQQAGQRQLAGQLAQQQQQLAALQAELSERAQALELARLLLERATAGQRSGELMEQRRRFSALQEQATAVKARLAALPAISAEQLQGLRQAEQRLALAQTRLEAMAATLEVLATDQPLQLDGRPLATGASVQISQAAALKVGQGVRLRIQPGGGEALGQAEAELQAAGAALAGMQQQLAVADGDAAEQLLRQRSALESELTQLRRNAKEIAWQRLDSQIADQAARIRQLDRALAEQQHLLEGLQGRGALPADTALEGWLAATRLLQHQGQARWQALQQEHQRDLVAHQQLQERLQLSGGRLGELEGRLAALQQRQASLAAEHGNPDALQGRADALRHQLARHDAQLDGLSLQLSQLRQQAAGSDPQVLGQRLQQLVAEKESLLSQRGQNEQLCRSLGASDPQAAVEQADAALEAAEEQLAAIAARAAALELLLERFRSARSALADRYSQPLAQAIAGHLTSLEAGTDAALLQFDTARGFTALQLRQGSESFGFEKLSGGTREQVAAAVRLALAEVLAPAYDGVLPLVFDDAFTNSDPQRLQGLSRMLERASSQGVQVLLLSCTPNDYADLARRIGSQVNLATATL